MVFMHIFMYLLVYLLVVLLLRLCKCVVCMHMCLIPPKSNAVFVRLARQPRSLHSLILHGIRTDIAFCRQRHVIPVEYVRDPDRVKCE